MYNADLRFQQPDSPWQIAWRRFKKHKLASYSFILLALLSLIIILVPWILEMGFHYDSNVTRIDERFLPLSWQHPLGTDDLGRDVLLRIFYGGRISLAIALISAFFSLFIGLAIGAWAGYYG